MTKGSNIAALLCILVVAGCQHVPPLEPRVARVPMASADSDSQVNAEPTLEPPPPIESPTPPCFPVDTRPKSAPKRHIKPAIASSAPSAESIATPLQSPGEPSVKSVGGTSLSVLGKKVRGPKGDDFGRVVDVLADAQGRVQLAIIEAGGFLGVGNRRIAVDWALLKFDQDASFGVLTLAVSAKDFQSAPEYRDNGHPFALMAPEATPAVKQ
jgi:PRC-barrel domain